ncbi:MAG: AbrB family transcriptional regulator [Nevskia sp.]|nr:AbrB family transcriptional regulator [Nevskia sp.]
MTATAKVFTTGRSQAVRIPKDYRFDCDEVTVERDGERLILTPKRTAQISSWAELAALAPLLDDDFEIPKHPPGSERDIVL